VNLDGVAFAVIREKSARFGMLSDIAVLHVSQIETAVQLCSFFSVRGSDRIGNR